MNELYVAPATLRNANLSDIAELLHDQRARALDVVAPASAITAHRGRLLVAGTDVVLDEDGVTPTAGTYQVTEIADGGIADKLGIPTGTRCRTCRQA